MQTKKRLPLRSRGTKEPRGRGGREMIVERRMESSCRCSAKSERSFFRRHSKTAGNCFTRRGTARSNEDAVTFYEIGIKLSAEYVSVLKSLH